MGKVEVDQDTPSGSVGGTSLIGKSLQVEDKIKNDDTSCSTTSRGEDLPKNEDRQSLEADSESDSSCASRRKQNVNPFQFQGLATGSRSRENSCSSCDSREQAPNPFQFQGFVNTQPKSCSSGFRERQSLTNKKECATSASPCGDRVVSCPTSRLLGTWTTRRAPLLHHLQHAKCRSFQEPSSPRQVARIQMPRQL